MGFAIRARPARRPAAGNRARVAAGHGERSPFADIPHVVQLMHDRQRPAVRTTGQPSAVAMGLSRNRAARISFLPTAPNTIAPST